jgi:rSAM/selenodomain-associated transferase 2
MLSPLSVVIPVLDEEQHLEAVLPDLKTTCPGTEVVVVDGGSEDGTRDVVARFPGITLVSSARGRARQMNAGAAAAGGAVLLFLHADTRLPPGAAAAVLAALDDPATVGGRFDVAFDNPHPAFRMIAALMNVRSRLSRICTGDQAIFVRRRTFEALGGYRDIPLMEDVDFTRRLKRAGRLACLRQRVTTSARKWEREGIIRTIVLMWTLRGLWFCGVAPERLHRWYYPPMAAADPEPRGAAPAGRPPR